VYWASPYCLATYRASYWADHRYRANYWADHGSWASSWATLHSWANYWATLGSWADRGSWAAYWATFLPCNYVEIFHSWANSWANLAVCRDTAQKKFLRPKGGPARGAQRRSQRENSGGGGGLLLRVFSAYFRRPPCSYWASSWATLTPGPTTGRLSLLGQLLGGSARLTLQHIYLRLPAVSH